jgi:hypothetical protein
MLSYIWDVIIVVVWEDLMGFTAPALTLLVQDFYRGTVFGLGLIVSCKLQYKVRLLFFSDTATQKSRGRRTAFPTCTSGTR